ncbi:MAG: hypothetical protein ACO1OB_04230, partial [Archangium sp.]
LTRAGAELAMDSNITAAGREFNDAAGARFTDYPQSINVRYRVFLRDDVDEASPSATVDSNAQVWLVSIGEVDIGGGMPIRRVTQALITFSAGAANIDCLGQKGGCADKTNAAVLDANAPSGTTRSL